MFPRAVPTPCPHLNFPLFPDNGQAAPVAAAPSKPRAQDNKEQTRFMQCMSLCVCYSASIGGIATLTGTTPNLVLQGQVYS